jgi:DNA polymerase I
LSEKLCFILDVSWYAHRAWGVNARQFGVNPDTFPHHNFAAKSLKTNLEALQKEWQKAFDDGIECEVYGALDSGATWRHMLYPRYKSHRRKGGEWETKFIRETAPGILEAAGCVLKKAPGYEADDVIATLAKDAEARGFEVRMMSADFDLGQMVNDNIFMVVPTKESYIPVAKREIGVRSGYEKLDREGVKRRFGTYPERVGLYKAIKGDAGDGFIGIRGMGEGAAKRICAEYSSIGDIYANLAKFTKSEQALITKARDSEYPPELFEQLARLDSDLKLVGASGA